MKELWRDVVGYEGHYQVSDKGQVKSLKLNKEALLKQFLGHAGYPRINLMKNGKLKQFFVHRLVAEAFIGSLEGKQVNHVNGVKTDNRLVNLELVSGEENIRHAHKYLGCSINPVLQLDPDSLEVINIYKNVSDAAKKLGIEETSIHRVCNNERNFAGGFSWILHKDHNGENLSLKKKKIEKKHSHHRKVVYQIDPETNKVIRTFPGVRIAERELGLSSIKHCVSGITKTAGGFKWSYDNPEEKLIN